MIRQVPGDVLEVEFNGEFCYLVVLTKVVQFGGNIVYAFHGDGLRNDSFHPDPSMPGFNICVDLLLAKKEGIVKRLGKVDDVNSYYISDFVKSTFPLPPGEKARFWSLKPIKDLSQPGVRVTKLSKVQEMAMDSGTHSFDLLVSKILGGYTPDKDPRIDRRSWLSKLFPNKASQSGAR